MVLIVAQIPWLHCWLCWWLLRYLDFTVDYVDDYSGTYLDFTIESVHGYSGTLASPLRVLRVTQVPWLRRWGCWWLLRYLDFTIESFDGYLGTLTSPLRVLMVMQECCQIWTSSIWLPRPIHPHVSEALKWSALTLFNTKYAFNTVCFIKASFRI